ncbi:5-azacytidine resistance protein azr1 [Colletotrichum orbiculare MAFF 240422]|uniref:Protein phosphatase n=1 Tax=Colletotrichum orbiculare (strain 104-T / ATCC 96160 / CBS 514.97 / LARS 414 / MAFF 240422) TaxID=1213857 RepID=N4VWQ8_COLOR|nr:5-azacytidine resistance protein azr1 [Colletotrichum orbiculare MAFF 240422]
MASDSPTKLSYHVAASFNGKDRTYDPSRHIFHFNPYNRIQKSGNKRSRPDSGHDAFFVSRVGDSGAVALGVADGVGGWVDSGVDPADFSHGFCDYMASTAHGHGSIKNDPSTKGTGATDHLRAQALMQTGYQAICEDETVLAGGSTACVAVASVDGNLDVANLGDSGFIQLRLNAVHTCSEPQTHAFNTPYQLSIVPPSVAARMAAFGGANLCDFPADADVTQHDLRHGDIVVFATDGVWDNLFNQDILRIVSRVMTSTGAWLNSRNGVRVVDNLKPFTQPSGEVVEGSKTTVWTLQSVLAVEITAAAKSASMNRKMDGPFAKGVQKYYPNENWHGGKIDDICVVVMIASDDSKIPVKSRL